jgi:hypothetical protein
VDVAFFILVCLDFRLAAPSRVTPTSFPIFGPLNPIVTPFGLLHTSVASPSPFATAHPQENALPERQLAPPTTTITNEFTFFLDDAVPHNSQLVILLLLISSTILRIAAGCSP